MSLHKSFLLLFLTGSTLATQAVQHEWMLTHSEFDSVKNFGLHKEINLPFLNTPDCRENQRFTSIFTQDLLCKNKIEAQECLQDLQLKTQILLLQVLVITSQDA